MKTVNFLIYRDEDGILVADCTNAGIVTDGKTFDELIANIKEATALHFEGDSTHNGVSLKSPFFTLTYTDSVQDDYAKSV